MSQTQVQKTHSKTATATEEIPEEVTVEENEEAQRLIAEADALLDEIDLLLEPNAQEFIEGYVQKGGE